MTHTSYIEGLFLEADQALEEGNLSEGKRLLEEILSEEPSFGRAHNHLGWLYKTKYQDYSAAEKHYKLALKFDPKYPSTYLNYIYMLRDLGRLNDLREMLDKALQIDSTDKCALHDEYGSYYELNGNFSKAITHYQKAIALSLNDKLIDELKGHVKRCKKKMNFWSRLPYLFK